MTLLHLPPRPRSVTTLSNEQRERTERVPFCPTCGRTKTFEWYAYSSTEWQEHNDRCLAEGKSLPNPMQVKTYECPCDDQYVLARYLGFWGIHRKFQRASYYDIVPEEALKAYHSCLDNLGYFVRNGVGMYLQGGSGLGKSLIAALVAKEAIKAGFLVRFATFVDLLKRNDDTFVKSGNSAEAKALFAVEVTDVDLLVIDDLGKENLVDSASPETVRRFISELLRQRDQRGLSTFVSANVFAHKMGDRYGQDVASLVTGNFEVLTLAGEDFRNRLEARRKAETASKLIRPVMM
jgi:DNA replication protein DnaC